MNWFDAVLLILWAMGLLILIGLGRKLEAKLDAVLNLVAALTGPKVVMGPFNPEPGIGKPPEEKTVYHLTPEHDNRVLGDEDL